MTIAERDAAMMNSWKERQGSLANAEFEDGQVAEGYRRNVVRYISCHVALASLNRFPMSAESQYIPLHIIDVYRVHGLS